MKTTKKMFTFLIAALMILSVFPMTSIASAANSAQDSVPVQGPTVTADPDSPTGYTVTFVYYNPNATGVRLAGDLTLLDVNTGPSIRYQPEEWQLGRYHVGGVEFLRDMTQDADGYWSATIPMHAGGLSYWYRVDDPTQGWTNHRIWDPAGMHPRPTIDPANPIFSTPFRVRNNDVLGAVYVPLDAEKQNDPTLISRATHELPRADPAKRGTVQYIPYTTILGDYGYHLGVYLPAGYDANRAEPYKVVYLAHGIFGDETDFMIPINVPNILDNMIARGEIEPTVVVTMGNHFTGTSVSFFSYNTTNAANNLVQTILPFIEANYNVSDKREGRAFGGFSYGGSTGGIVIRDYPTVFGYYGFFSGNPSLTTENYDNIAASVGANSLFVFLGNGYFEGSLNAANTRRDNFRSREIYSETAQVRGAHDMMTAGMLFTIFARDYLWTLPEQQIASLKEAVAGMVTGGINQALTVKLDQALKLLSKDKPSQAIQVLNAFINQVNGLSGVKLTEEQAAELIQAAEQTILTIMNSG
jgi:enterochelin esterase-like enzyme